ncbi:MAG: arylsulfatase [Candidatus Aminicenantes bacterium]|nr:arylsulfatase [Candidatus Aminicenantes bacterium]
MASDNEQKPNIIYILADDLGYREVGCFGQKKIKTPNIDSLAAEGIKFTNHYSGNAVCAPSRCCLMTGLHPGHAYIRGNADYQMPNCERGQIPLPLDAITITKLAKKAGYVTGVMGKWGLGGQCTSGAPENQGIDHFFGYLDQWEAHFYYPDHLWRNTEKVLYPENKIRTGETYSADEIAKEALTFIKQNKDRPFFLYLPFTIPHVSLQVPDDEILQYYKSLGWDETPYEGDHYTGNPTPRATYAAMITRMDKYIGQIMDLVKQLGLDEDTIIMFSSDNGTTYCCGVDYQFFESVSPLKGLKGSLHEGGIRVPFIARWPGKIKPGTTSDHICAFWDMMPTLCDIMGIETPQHTDGISFLPALLGKGYQKEHEYLYWELPEYGAQQTVRMGRWKGYRTNLRKQAHPKLELYDLDADPGQEIDVADKHPDITKKIEEIMQEEHVYHPEFPLLLNEKLNSKFRTEK